MNFFSCCRSACLALATLSLASCAGFSQLDAPSQATWNQYLHASPFSYGTGDSVQVVRNLRAELGDISTVGVHPRLAAHIEAVERWTAAYPGYRIRAGLAYDEAYEDGKRWARPTGWLGRQVGKGMGEDDALSRSMNGMFGELAGRLGNEMYSRSSGEAAAARVMRPVLQEALLLSLEEFELNRIAGTAPTQHLRSLIDRLGGRPH